MPCNTLRCQQLFSRLGQTDTFLLKTTLEIFKRQAYFLQLLLQHFSGSLIIINKSFGLIALFVAVFLEMNAQRRIAAYAFLIFWGLLVSCVLFFFVLKNWRVFSINHIQVLPRHVVTCIVQFKVKYVSAALNYENAFKGAEPGISSWNENISFLFFAEIRQMYHISSCATQQNEFLL